MNSPVFLKWLVGTVPPAVFLLVLWSLLEPKCSPKTARWVFVGFCGVELAVQSIVSSLGGGPDLVFTLLPLTFCLPAMLGSHVLSARPFIPTAVGWLFAFLCQHLLMVVQKLLTLLGNQLRGPVWPWATLVLLLLAAASLMAFVFLIFRSPFRASAGALNTDWWPFLLLLVMLLALHSYFLSSTAIAIVLLLLLFTALAAFWALAKLMTALAAKERAREFSVQMEALRQDYELLQKKLELGRSYRHDVRHHMLALSALLQQGETEAALSYVSGWQGQLTQVENRSWCKNTAVNAVLSAYMTQAEESNCTLEAEVSLPEELPMEELDLCVSLANALENAIRACRAIPDGGERRIRLELALADNRRLTLHVENSCAQAVEIGDNGFPTGEREEGHGQGLKSIAAVAGKYHGIFRCNYSDGVFSLWVVLLDAAPEPRHSRRAPAVCAGIFLALFLLNCMPTLAQALEAVPVLGSVVRVVDLRSYSLFWGDTGISIQDPVLDGDIQAVSQVEQKKEEFIAQMQDVFLHYATRKYQGYVAEDVSYEVMRDDEELFILRFDATLNAGGSVDYHSHIILDKRTEQVLKLADLFHRDANFVFPISREIRAQMEEQVKAGTGSYFLPGGIWSDDTCFQSIDPEEQDFYINDAGQLVIAFAEYEVSPGYMGSPEFIIPTEVLDGLLAQPSLLK